ncbi:MAG: hypothetical protein MK116_11890 [Phycisphaerales bacterium]|nr:hypothetical protein [Phycisphaerales bacterium]
MRYPITTSMAIASTVVMSAAALAGGSGGVRNGSFAEASNGDWQYTGLKSNSFSFDVDVLADLDAGRDAFVRLDLSRMAGVTEDAFPGESPGLYQENIQLVDCRDASVFMLQFDYRATAVTGFYALRVTFDAKLGNNVIASTTAPLLGMGADEVAADPFLGWTTTQLTIELDEEVDPSAYNFDVRFEVLAWGADTSQPVCGVAFPVIDLDQVSIMPVAAAGESVPDWEPICGDAWAAMVMVDFFDASLVTEAVDERAIDPIYRHRTVNPLEIIECGPGGWPETPCLFHLPTMGVSYDPAEEICRADFNGDGLVNGADLSLLLAYWNATDSIADLNCSGLVDGGDLSILLGEWGFCTRSEGLIAPPNL